MKYTFTISEDEENKFRRILERLDDDEYTMIEEIHPIWNPFEARTSDRQAIIEMDPESALTFRLGMREVKIRRERTEEELAEEKRINDQHTIKITVHTGKADLSDPNVLAEKLEGIQLR
jgi:hypothetical protein